MSKYVTTNPAGQVLHECDVSSQDEAMADFIAWEGHSSLQEFEAAHRAAGDWSPIAARLTTPSEIVGEEAIRALADAGYVVVPRKPTDAMVSIGGVAVRDVVDDAFPHAIARYAWEIMIAAYIQSNGGGDDGR